jgi:hypothetical protein
MLAGMSTPLPPVSGRNMTSLTPSLLRQSVGYRLRMKQGRKSKQRYQDFHFLPFICRGNCRTF